MAANFSFDFSRDGLEDPKELDRKLTRAAFATVKYWDGRAEAHMKQKAPWTDRTANARNGLFAVARKTAARTFAIILGHSVTYGIWLERGHSQETRDGEIWVEARPIIIPTIELFAPQVMRTFNKILGRL